jgi:hypothetical protein
MIDQASLHPATVTAVSTGGLSPLKTKPAKARRKPGTVRRRKVHPGVWREAMRLAKGDVTRLVVRTYDQVSVLNHPAKGARR